MSADSFSNDDLRDARAEAGDPLWSLLARAPLPAPDAWFATRTLARCRLDAPAAAWAWWRLPRWALGAGLGLSVALFAGMHLQRETVVAAHQRNVQEAFAIVASMSDDGDSSAASTSTSWPDSSSQ